MQLKKYYYTDIDFKTIEHFYAKHVLIYNGSIKKEKLKKQKVLYFCLFNEK